MSAVGYDFKFTGEAIWKILVACLILGAGLPALFAVGVRSLAWGQGGAAEASADGTASTARPNILGTIIAVILFAIVAYAIVSGIVWIIGSGKGDTFTFKHGYPEIYKKS